MNKFQIFCFFFLKKSRFCRIYVNFRDFQKHLSETINLMLLTHSSIDSSLVSKRTSRTDFRASLSFSIQLLQKMRKRNIGFFLCSHIFSFSITIVLVKNLFSRTRFSESNFFLNFVLRKIRYKIRYKLKLLDLKLNFE